MPYSDKDRQADYQRRWHQGHKVKNKSRSKLRRTKNKDWFNQITEGMHCLLCGESERVVLDWHHIDPTQKDFLVPRMVHDFRSHKAILEEMDKCVVLCSNCHRKLHAGIVVLPVYITQETLVEV